MNKTLEIHLSEQREAIARAIELAHAELKCSAIAVAVCSCALSAKIARGGQ